MDSSEPPSKKLRDSESSGSGTSVVNMARSIARTGLTWLCSYNKRCPLVRYFKTANVAEEDMVKFFYKDLERDEIAIAEFTLKGFKWRKEMGRTTMVDDMIKCINKPIVQAGIKEFTLIDLKEKPFWAKLLTLVDEINLKVPEESFRNITGGLTMLTDQDKVDLLSKEFPDQMGIICNLVNALLMDFTNGHAKKFMLGFIDKMVSSFPVKHRHLLDVNIPELNYGGTSRLETCFSKGQFDAEFPPSCTAPPSEQFFNEGQFDADFPTSHRAPLSPLVRSASASYMSCHRNLSSASSAGSGDGDQRKVPDCEVYMYGEPGRFPLVVKTKTSTDSVDEADEQNLQQMFTKFYFQDIIFGLRISVFGFSFQVLVKDSDASSSNRNIIFSKTADIPLFSVDGNFQTKNLKLLFDFIYSILVWGSETKCILHKPKV